MTYKKNGSNKKRYFLFIFLLIFLYPLGLLVSWLFSKWRIKTKVLITLPFIVIVLLIICWNYFLRPFNVIGNSMFPIAGYDSNMLVNILEQGDKGAVRGNIVIFYDPDRSDSITYVGRVIGVAGERIMVRQGRVYINDAELPETYLYSFTKTQPGLFLAEGVEKTIPYNEVAILGDNREESGDSRDQGFFKTKDILGKVVYIF